MSGKLTDEEVAAIRREIALEVLSSFTQGINRSLASLFVKGIPVPSRRFLTPGFINADNRSDCEDGRTAPDEIREPSGVRECGL